jgi:hypothetical protein
LTHILHQPLGEITPSTVLQEDGAWNKLQLAQLRSPLGESWYATEASDIFAKAGQALIAKRGIELAAATLASTERRVISLDPIVIFVIVRLLQNPSSKTGAERPSPL